MTVYRAGGSIICAVTGKELNADPHAEAETLAHRLHEIDAEIATIRRTRYEETRAALKRLGFDVTKYKPITDDPIDREIPTNVIIRRPGIGQVVGIH